MSIWQINFPLVVVALYIGYDVGARVRNKKWKKRETNLGWQNERERGKEMIKFMPMIWMSIFCAGVILGSLIEGILTRRECADCHVGSLDQEWWRKAVALAQFRKSEKERNGK